MQYTGITHPRGTANLGFVVYSSREVKMIFQILLVACTISTVIVLAALAVGGEADDNREYTNDQ